MCRVSACGCRVCCVVCCRCCAPLLRLLCSPRADCPTVGAPGGRRGRAHQRRPLTRRTTASGRGPHHGAPRRSTEQHASRSDPVVSRRPAASDRQQAAQDRLPRSPRGDDGHARKTCGRWSPRASCGHRVSQTHSQTSWLVQQTKPAVTAPVTLCLTKGTATPIAAVHWSAHFGALSLRCEDALVCVRMVAGWSGLASRRVWLMLCTSASLLRRSLRSRPHHESAAHSPAPAGVAQ